MTLSNLKDNRLVPVMHGENFLRPVDSIPNGKKTTTKMYIVGHSESGHNHVLQSKKTMQITEVSEKRYLLIKEVSQLFHQKNFDIHETIDIAPGMYEVTHKTEYDPFAKVVRGVWD